MAFDLFRCLDAVWHMKDPPSKPFNGCSVAFFGGCCCVSLIGWRRIVWVVYLPGTCANERYS